MNKAIIQQLLDAEETRARLAVVFGQAVDSSDAESYYDDLMVEALNKLNDILAVGEMITIEVSDHMWVRGEYLCTEPDGRLLVSIPGKNPGSCVANEEIYTGKRIKLERSEMSE